MKRSLANILLVIFNILFVMSCTGIGGTGGTIDETVKPPKNQKLIQGKVTRVSLSEKLITVGGYQIKPNDGAITRDSIAIEISSVRAGQIVVVEAADDDEDGIYEGIMVNIDEQITGPVSKIGTNSFQISGKTILVDDFTEYVTGSFATLEENNYVAVFGFMSETGSFTATLVEIIKNDFSATSDGVKFSGEVTAIDTESAIVTVDGVDVQLDPDRIKDIEVGDIIILDNLELNSSMLDGSPIDGTGPGLISEPRNYEKGLEVVLEGVPIQITEINFFTLNGYEIHITSELLEEKGIESIVDRYVLIKGEFVGDRSVLVSDIELLDKRDFEWKGVLESVSENSIVVYGKTIHINLNTFINFDLSDVKSDMNQNNTEYFVYVRGLVEANGEITATQISIKNEVEDRNNLLEGKVESISESLIVVSGISVQLGDSVILANDESITGAEAILALISIGDEIHVKGEFSRDGFFVANSIEVSDLTSSEEEEVQVQNELGK